MDGSIHPVTHQRTDLKAKAGPRLSCESAVFEMGEDQRGFGDIADLAWTGGGAA